MRFLVLLALMLSSPAAANEALVKSGEHADFSRLVVYLPNRTEWELTQEKEVAILSLKGWSKGFDTSRIFELIPKTRLTGINSSKSEMRLTLGCDCGISIESLDRIGLIIDISDAELATSSSPAAIDIDINPLGNWPTNNRFAPISEPTESAQLLRKVLNEKIGKASTQLILSPTNVGRPAISPDRPEQETKQQASFPLDRLRATSATNRAMAAELETTLTNPTPTCPDAALGEIELWATNEPFARQLGQIRTRLVGEFDEIQNRKILELARLYLSYAMTHEALTALENYDLAATEATYIELIAKILDGDDVADRDPKLPVNGCQGSMSIWAALQLNAENMTESQSKLVSAAFSELPHHLRSNVGPRLIAKMKREGHVSSAGTIQNTLFLQAVRHTLEEPNHDLVGKSIDELRQMIALNNDISPDALLALMDEYWEQRLVLDDAMLDIANSYVVQLQGDPRAIDLQFNLSRHDIILGNFRNVFASSHTLALPQKKAELVRLTISEAYRTDDATFAIFAIAARNSGLLDQLSSTQRKAGAERLSRLGLKELANQFDSRNANKVSSDLIQSKQVLAPALEDIPQANRSSAIPSEPTILSAQDTLEYSQSMRESVSALLQDQTKSAK